MISRFPLPARRKAAENHRREPNPNTASRNRFFCPFNELGYHGIS
jgi:hypothetical protein